MKNSIKELRARHQLTQEDLAHKVGVSRQTINAIEQGKFDPSLPLGFKLAHLLHTPSEGIFTHESIINK
ncbi:MAG: helix-turn-helix transcriptional regulator [Flavobacteriaceae bacterium]